MSCNAASIRLFFAAKSANFEAGVVGPVVSDLVGTNLVHERDIGRVGFGPAFEADQRDDLGVLGKAVLLAGCATTRPLQDWAAESARRRQSLLEAPLRNQRCGHPMVPAAERIQARGR